MDVINISEQLEEVISGLEDSERVIEAVLSGYLNFAKADHDSEEQEERENAYDLCYNYSSYRAMLNISLCSISEKIKALKEIDNKLIYQLKEA